uniref:LEM domain-containing protein n=1 Tax=Strigamia maritima TaxID=126957 RepID=T1IWS4_STRMM
MFRGRKHRISETSQKLDLARQLCDAIENGDIKSCHEFLDEGGDSNLLLPDRAVTPFHLAVGSDAANSIPIVELCLQYGANPNIRDSEGLTPVHVSASWGKADVLKVLLENGGNPALTDENGESSLDVAVENNQPECVKVLLDFEKCNNIRLSLTSLSLGNDSFVIKKLNSNTSLIIPKTRTFSQPSCCQQSPSEENGCTCPSDTSIRLKRSTSDSLFNRTYSTTSFHLDKYLSKSTPRTSSSGLHSKSMFDIELERSSSKRSTSKKLDFDLRNASINEDLSSAYMTCVEASSPSATTPYSHGLALTKFFSDDDIESFGSVFSPAEIVSCDPGTKEKVVRILDSPSMNGLECRAIGDYTMVRKNCFLDTKTEISTDFEFLTSSPFTSFTSFTSFRLDDSIEQLRSDVQIEKCEQNENEEFEEFIYSDRDENIKLIERRTPSMSKNSKNSMDLDLDSTVYVDCTAHSWKEFAADATRNDQSLSSLDENVIVTPDIEALSNSQLREVLVSLGDEPGPITGSTRSVYQLRLARLQQYPNKYSQRRDNQPLFAGYSKELQLMIEGKHNLTMVKELESKMRDIFDRIENPNRQWREGRAKNCFNYLLLDPRVTRNLPLRSAQMSREEQLRIFLASVFYIGKGKRTRPYSHLYEAALLLKQGTRPTKVNDKVQHILNIWAEGSGVISLHCFQSVIPVEAYTREACMLDAIGRKNVTNVRNGEVYGAVCRWTGQKRRFLGAYLLHCACNIFLNEGERQIRPADM